MAEPRIPLLEADPELARHLAAADAEQARGVVTVPVCTLPAGPLRLQELAPSATNPFAAIIVTGLVTRQLDIGAQPAMELLGPGDVFVGRQLAGSLPTRTRLEVAVPTRIALLDDRLVAAVRRWPRLLPGIVQRVCEQRDRVALQLAISHQPRVEDRLLSLFRHLSDRFGHVTPDGICVPLALTHEALGRLIGARRPTVTLAVGALEARGVLRRSGARAWLLTGGPGRPEPDADAAEAVVSRATN